MLNHRKVYNDDQRMFRQSVRRFVSSEIEPNFERWEAAGIVDRELWRKAGESGILCAQVPEEYGGTGDFRFNAVVIEECSYAGFAGPTGNFTAHSDVSCGYILDYGSEDIRKTWLPRMVSGEAVCSIAMSEPAAGSDLQGLRTRAVRDGDDYVISGQKTFISNGQHCDIAVVVAKTDSDAGSRGMSLFLVEIDRPGFSRGRNLEKLGHHSADTSEMFFDNVRVPVTNLLGQEGGAMAAMMAELPQERLIIAVASIAAAQKAFDITVDYVRQRRAFGSAIGDMQNTRFKLADLKAELKVGWAFVDQCLGELVQGELTSDRASIAKMWVTEMQGRVVDQCVQFFGGYGFMREYEICRLYADARVQRIYGGSNEIMREIIARAL
ncbi:acyl-CoA dehydrogenase family protein [Candidatus Protofrankia californiensis]|uniref:acyl-CoA dehydrogenase family protein n=1 Tax=Candidatus Protofrankia californiensis TaxID=1839754 RepID=UPI0010415E17|nr:acyl-CoA dehydrogenase family protein [Candidatus Protofrankia californiensis]